MDQYRLLKQAGFASKFMQLFRRVPKAKSQAQLVQEMLADLRYRQNNPLLFPEMLGESRAKALAAEQAWSSGLGKVSFSKYASLCYRILNQYES